MRKTKRKMIAIRIIAMKMKRLIAGSLEHSLASDLRGSLAHVKRRYCMGVLQDFESRIPFFTLIIQNRL